MLKFREILQRVEPYRPGKPIDEVKRELKLADIHKLASNENPLGPSPLAIKAIEEELHKLNLYPDAGCYLLKKKLSEKFGFPVEQVVIGAGSEQLLHYLIDAFVDKGDEVVMPWPSFSIYDINTCLREGVSVKVPLDSEFRLDLPAMLKAISDKTKIVFICNPNNPSATVVGKDALNEFLAAVADDVLVVLDEAYFEYAEPGATGDGMKYLRQYDNVIVLRTFSKAYGLAGLRVGYGIGPASVAEAIGRVKDSFNVHNMAQVAAQAAIDDKEHLQRTVELNRSGKEYLYTELCKLGLNYAISQTNFILFEVRMDSAVAFEGLLRRGVIVRPGHLLGHPGYLRVSTGLPSENELLIKALKEVLIENSVI